MNRMTMSGQTLGAPRNEGRQLCQASTSRVYALERNARICSHATGEQPHTLVQSLMGLLARPRGRPAGLRSVLLRGRPLLLLASDPDLLDGLVAPGRLP
eukprot:12356234-Alexandrium_andersonii.AAC.1